MPASDLPAFKLKTRQEASGKPKHLGSRGSMVAKLKLKGIDGSSHQEWILRLNLTQHGETYQVKTMVGLTVYERAFLIRWVVVHGRS